MKEPGQRPFAGLDLRRPKGYPAVSTAPAPAAADPCPRCESRDTKFCYYNNYNTSQPRHYCRSCRRYWTKGGSLRNVPVGGGSLKGTSSSSSAASPKSAKNSKRRRVALAAPPEPEPGTIDAASAAEKEAMAGTTGYPATDVDVAPDNANSTVAVGVPATDVDAGRTQGTANGTVDGPATVVDAARTEATADGPMDDPGAPPAVDYGGFADAGGEEAPDLSPFEWPSGCDLGSYWAPGVFLNLP
ncbi:hypothetical protein ACQ4PT_041175 [Festuca glaucescens]